MMTTPRTYTPKPPPVEARCRTCGGWIATVPAGTPWARGRCIDKRCPRYGEGQTVKLRPAAS